MLMRKLLGQFWMSHLLGMHSPSCNFAAFISSKNSKKFCHSIRTPNTQMYIPPFSSDHQLPVLNSKELLEIIQNVKYQESPPPGPEKEVSQSTTMKISIPRSVSPNDAASQSQSKKPTTTTQAKKPAPATHVKVKADLAKESNGKETEMVIKFYLPY